MSSIIQSRRDTAANWSSVNPILAQGEKGYETDSIGTSEALYKIGDGVSTWSSLSYQSSGGGAVDSVNGEVGIVVLDTSDISETTDKNYVTDSEKTAIGSQSGTNTGDETSSTIKTKRPIKTINGDSLEGSGNIITTDETLIVEGTIEDTNTLNSVSGNAVYENTLSQEFYYSRFFDTDLPIEQGYRYGSFLDISYFNLTGETGSIADEDIYIRYFRNNTAGALIQFVLSDLTAVGQINLPGSLKTGVETISMPTVGGYGFKFTIKINWDTCANYYDGSKGTTIKLDTQFLFDQGQLTTEDFVKTENTSYNYVDGLTYNYTITPFDSVTGIISDPNNLKITYDSKGLRRFIEAGTGVGIQRIQDFKIFDDSFPTEIQIVYFDLKKNTALSVELKVRANTDIINDPIQDDYVRIIVGYSLYNSTDNTYSFESDFLGIHSVNSTSDATKRQTQLNTEAIQSIENKVSKVGVKSAFNSSLISNQQPFYDNLQSLDKDLEIVTVGDSLFALTSTAGVVEDGTIEANRPPSMINDAFVYRFWKGVNHNKPDYDRYDSAVNAFTETGTFTDSFTDWDAPDWTGEFRSDGSLTRFSSDSNAKISLGWDLDAHEKLNFIHRKTPSGSQNLTLTIVEGNSKSEVYNGSTWVEANGFSFDQYVDPSIAIEGSGFSLYLANVKLKMRKATGATGTATIEVTKPSDATTLYYWGTERWNGNSIFVTNVARGGRPFFRLSQNMRNDIAERNPDFVIIEAPMLNEIRLYSSDGYQDIVNNAQDCIYGDRVGFETNNSLKVQSNDFADFQVLVVMPHYRDVFFNGNKFLNYTFDGLNNADATPFETYSRVKKMIRDKGLVSVADLSGQMILECNANLLGYEAQYAASGVEGSTFTGDGAHLNRYSSRLWSAYLEPIFNT